MKKASFQNLVEYVVAKSTISPMEICKNFGVSYNEANRILRLLEERGVIGPVIGGARPRSVLMKSVPPWLYTTPDIDITRNN